MKRRTVVASALGAAALASSMSVVAPALADPPPVVQAIGISQATLPRFLQIRSEAPTPFDWSTDGCSSPWFAKIGSGAIPGVNWTNVIRQLFTEPCIRHDFGYRNFGKKRLDPTAARKDFVDRKFYEDMQGVCARQTTAGGRDICRGAASLAYGAVRAGGNSSFYP